MAIVARVSITKNSMSVPAYRADRDEWNELLGATPTPKRLADVGLSPATWLDICSGQSPFVPDACFRLARFQRYGELSELMGSAWRDFFACPEGLLFPGMKYCVPAQELRALWVRVHELGSLQTEVRMADAAMRRPNAHALPAASYR